MQRTCERCEGTFTVWSSAIGVEGKGRFCSKHCSSQDRADQARGREEGPRFWRLVDMSSGPNACWPYMGHRVKNGYGRFYNRHGVDERAHRVAFRLFYGKVAERFVLHSCDNRACCNPAHLREGDARDNSRDAMERKRTTRGERHGNAKLTQSDVDAIREAVRDGASQASQVRKYGVAAMTVSDVIRGATWQD